MKFIDHLAEKILSHDLPMDQHTVVLPSIRAKKYLESALMARMSKPGFAPKIQTIDKWIIEQSGMQVIDKTRLLFLLHEVHLELVDEEEDASFDAFQTWGQTLLSDFDDMSRYLANPVQLFSNLREIRRLEAWDLDEENLTPAQEKFLKFWDRLSGYYQGFIKKLEERNWAYAGQAFEFVAQKIEEKDWENQHITFAGLNALSLSEMEIIKKLQRMKKADVILDSDAFYLKAKHHEAGYFHRRLLQHLGVSALNRTTDILASAPKKVHTIACAQPTSQVQIAAGLLKDMSPQELNDCLLLLGDEELIDPVIRNLPMEIQRANITMGVPLNQTSLQLWVDLLFSIQENQERFTSKAFYHKDLNRLWHHPFYQGLSTVEEAKKMQEFEANILRYNKLFVNVDSLDFEGELKQALLQLMTQPWGNDFLKGLELMKKINVLVYNQLGEQFTLEKAALRSFQTVLQRVHALFAEGYPAMERTTFRKLLNREMAGASIAFEGNPLEGLQVMGLLETRLLDFKKIIILGMNEGKLPNDNPFQTLLPMDLRSAFNLPVTRDKQALFAHHFYRLLHFAEDITITHSEGKSEMGFVEPSRYLQQLELEWTAVNPNIEWKKSVYTLQTKVELQPDFQVDKTDFILNKIRNQFESGLSASAVNKYLKCPLDFYYRYVLGLGEQDQVEENMDVSSFGSIVHEVLEKLFLPFAQVSPTGEKLESKGSVQVSDIQGMIPKIDTLIHQAFLEFYDNKPEAFLKGKNFLSYQISKRMVKKVLEDQMAWLSKQSASVHVHALERKLQAEITVPVNGEEQTIKLSGIIDRIDFVGESARLIDFKTGKVDATKMSFKKNNKSIDTSEDIIKNLDGTSHVLQLLFYAYLFKANYGYAPKELFIHSAISNVNEVGLLDTKGYTIDQLIDGFPEALGKVIESMLDTTSPFEHNSAATFCNYCENVQENNFG